ncbi:MAG: hypothetical protein LUJ09_04005, partial [Firmicutes bacterium]|nr:hypothetical protein [Bacillota bacterium]
MNRLKLTVLLPALLLAGCAVTSPEQTTIGSTAGQVPTASSTGQALPTQSAPTTQPPTLPDKQVWDPESGGIYDLTDMLPQIDGYYP